MTSRKLDEIESNDLGNFQSCPKLKVPIPIHPTLRMSEWVNEWEWASEGVNEWVSEWVRVSEWGSEWMSEWMSESERVRERMNEWAREWMSEACSWIKGCLWWKHYADNALQPGVIYRRSGFDLSGFWQLKVTTRWACFGRNLFIDLGFFCLRERA